jgi:quercetin dioxygenase-like cupin family protein
VYSTPDGESHIEEMEIQQQSTVMFGVTIQISTTFRATGVQLIAIPAGDEDVGWHNAPGRMLCAVLSGSMEFEVSDGGRKTINVGDVALLEDIEGKGHIARHPNGLTVAFIAVPDGLSKSK